MKMPARTLVFGLFFCALVLASRAPLSHAAGPAGEKAKTEIVADAGRGRAIPAAANEGADDVE